MTVSRGCRPARTLRPQLAQTAMSPHTAYTAGVRSACLEPHRGHHRSVIRPRHLLHGVVAGGLDRHARRQDLPEHAVAPAREPLMVAVVRRRT